MMGIGILSPSEIGDELRPVRAGYSHHGLSRPLGGEFTYDNSSVDLPLGETFWEMSGSCRAGGGLNVGDLIRHHASKDGPKELLDGTVLRRNKVYLIKCDCTLDLKGKRIQGKATARSSIGRLDVLVRLVTDSSEEFDQVPEGAAGDLYVEVAPITFDLLVRPGMCLSQLRLFRGAEYMLTASMGELEYESQYPVVDANGKEKRRPVDRGRDITYPFSLDLTPDPSSDCCGFVAKGNPADPVDPDKRDNYAPRDFWDPVTLDGEALKLEPDRLYILRSRERLKLPGNLAVECQAYTESMGEWRIEYAGFAHPHFGSGRPQGTPLIYEVRGHNVPTFLRDGLKLGNVHFRRMSTAVPAEARGAGAPGPQYEDQELKLSSCFKAWSA